MTREEKPYRVLLFYQYVPIEDPASLVEEHRAFCQELGVKGRILIASEGINGTLSGTVGQTQRYMDYMNQHPLFKEMPFKVDEYHQHAFKKLFVRLKKELVTWRLERDVKPYQKTGKRLKPKDFYQMLQRDDVVVLDGRNDYEYDLGHFRGSIRPDVHTTREFPDWIRKNLKDYKDKTILTYCTGGIRCEKLTAFMLEEGFKDVYQLDGGIISYGKDPEVKGQLWDGKCYVFDERISVPINQVEETVVGKCYHCGKPTDRYLNCEYNLCHKQHLCCEECEQTYQGYCSEECIEQDMVKYEG